MIEVQLFRLRIGIYNRYKLQKINYNLDQTRETNCNLSFLSSYLIYTIYALLIILLYLHIPCMHNVRLSIHYAQ